MRRNFRMPAWVLYLVALFLAAHGLVHLLGTAVYLELADVAEFGYKTTLLGGAVDVGELGIRVFGLLWAVAALGFLAGTAGMLADWHLWRLLVAAAALFSLVLTVLDWTVASAGIAVNLVILAGLVFGPRL